MSREVVAVDIGGTHARFAMATVEGGRVVRLDEPVTLHTRDHASFQSAWQDFGRQLGRPLPRAAAIAIAAAVRGETIKMTNNPWIIRPAMVREKLDVDDYVLINDFAAIGHAVGQAEPTDYTHLCGPDELLPTEGTISIIGPGTGLGVAHVWRHGGQYRVQATEGGHIDFAPLDLIEDRLLERLRGRHRRVSVERVVSGPGIVDIYATLAAMEGRDIPAQLDDKEIWRLGMAGSDVLATAAVDRFCMSLGSVAGDIALAQGGQAVVIAGGLGLRLKSTLIRSGFPERFWSKGRFEGLMASMPVKLMTYPQPGLKGAAAAFAQEHP